MNTTTISRTGGCSSFFNLARFVAYFRLYVTANRRKLLLGASQILIICFIFNILAYYTGGKYLYQRLSGMGASGSFDPMWDITGQWYMLIAIGFSALAGSWMYSSVISKQKRLMTFEIPASSFEIFLTWWLIYLPLYLVALFLAYYLADCLRVLWIMLTSDYGAYAHVIPLSALFSFNMPEQSGIPAGEADNTALTTVMVYCFIAGCNAVYSLGSIFFGKLNFLKTLAATFVAMIVFVILTNAGYFIFFSGDHYNLSSRLNHDASSLWIVGSATAVLCAYFYWLGYARFKETEIVNRW